jgi:alpha-beta hydrolase superfamily lysophospholipase
VNPFAWTGLGALLAVGATLAGAIAWGGPRQPTPMASIAQPFRNVDFHALPAVERFTARDGASLAFRRYPAAAPPASAPVRGSVVLIHGSSAGSRSLHVLAQAAALAGYAAYALDMRGHGDSGPHGRIGHVGQLEEDLEDLAASVEPARPRTLLGFSSGGGFALRFASDRRQALFDGYLLLSPFLSQDAPTQRPGSGGWVSVGVPRWVAISIVNGLGMTAFNDLPVTAFAVEASNPAGLTTQYSFALAQNFRPRPDYRGDIAAARQPMAVLVGQRDEAFHAERFAEVFAARAPAVPVTVLPGLGHIAVTLEPAAIQAIISTLNQLASKGTLP